MSDGERCPTCGGGLDEAFQWRDWQTVALIQDCPDCKGTGDRYPQDNAAGDGS